MSLPNTWLATRGEGKGRWEHLTPMHRQSVRPPPSAGLVGKAAGGSGPPLNSLKCKGEEGGSLLTLRSGGGGSGLKKKQHLRQISCGREGSACPGQNFDKKMVPTGEKNIAESLQFIGREGSSPPPGG